MRTGRTTKLLVVLGLVGLAALPRASALPPNLEAQVVDAEFSSHLRTYDTIDFGRSASRSDDRHLKTEWRVVDATGNCCENYLTSDHRGRLYDFGGSYVNYTDDRGLTWKSVRPLTPLQNGEGAIAMAPGGDVVGVQWDPYTGDHLLSFKYDAKEQIWLYTEMPIKVPFYDREWIAVIPGPFEVDGTKVPYMSFIKGAWPSKEAWFYSYDGLNYDEVGSKFVDQTVFGEVVEKLRTKRHEYMDWTQPNTNGGITPLGGGAALASPDYPVGGETWAHFSPQSRRWASFTFEGKPPKGRYQVDSAGRLHNVVPNGKSFLYRVSDDWGKSWIQLDVSLPSKHVIEEIDFRANLDAGVAAVAIHGHESAGNLDRDLLFKFDITGSKPRLLRMYNVGLGDINGSSGVGAAIRFDFETVTIFPDGRVAMSFYDSTTTDPSDDTSVQPALAIEGRTK